MKITVIGSWHLANVFATGLASIGHEVTGVDGDADAIGKLNAGTPVIYEPGLQRLLRKHVAAGGLSFTTDFRQALDGSSMAFLAIDTPVTPTGVNIAPILDAARAAARSAAAPFVLVVSSQVPVGTCHTIAEVLHAEGAPEGTTVACNPEFLRLGDAVKRFRRPDYVVIGADDSATADRVQEALAPLRRPVVRMPLRDAEMVKHVVNAFMAIVVSYSGDVARLCDGLGINGFNLAKVLRQDARVGKQAYVRPGLGFSGETVERDVNVLREFARELDVDCPMLDAALESNGIQNHLVVTRLRSVLGDLRGVHIALLGLTYKPMTDTLRGSLALDLAGALGKHGARVSGVDPHVKIDGAGLQDTHGLRLCDSIDACVEGADVIVALTPKAFLRDLDFSAVKRLMRGDVFFDAANMFYAANAESAGFRYLAIGRGLA
jgi:UDPglucose 6-dehydrogenase